MVQQMIINELTNQASITMTIVALMFTVYHYKVYRYLIIVPLIMAIATVSYGNIPQCANDILYDVAFIVIAVGLVLSRVNLQLPHIDCLTCGKWKRK
jgi:hypothetical protein